MLEAVTTRIPAGTSPNNAVQERGVLSLANRRDDLLRRLPRLTRNPRLRFHSFQPLWSTRLDKVGRVLKEELDTLPTNFNESIRLDPKSAHPNFCRGEIWLVKGQYAKAIADFSKAIQLDARHGYAHAGRGYAWHLHGDSAKAIADYETSIRLQPNWSTGYRSLAWILAT